MREHKEIIASGKLWNVEKINGCNSALIKLPDCGTCSVIWGDNEGGWEHVSVSPRHKFKIPTWDDMCVIKDTFWNNDEEVYQIHPKKSEYVNLRSNCLHLWKPCGTDLGELLRGR